MLDLFGVAGIALGWIGPPPARQRDHGKRRGVEVDCGCSRLLAPGGNGLQDDIFHPGGIPDVVLNGSPGTVAGRALDLIDVHGTYIRSRLATGIIEAGLEIPDVRFLRNGTLADPALAVGFPPGPCHVDRESVCWQESKRAQKRKAVLAAQIIEAEIGIGRIAAAILRCESKTREQLVLEPADIDRDVDHAAGVDDALVADAYHLEALELFARLACGDIHSPSDRVFAEQSSLWSTQDFDAGNVEGVEDRGLRARKENTVHVHADAGIERHAR